MKDKFNFFRMDIKMYLFILLIFLMGLLILLFDYFKFEVPLKVSTNIHDFFTLLTFLALATSWSLTKDVSDLKSRFLVLDRLIIYCTFFYSIYLVSKLILFNVGFLDTNPESARYLLSTLVGSEVTVLALIVTISLVVVQLTIPYTPKISKMYRNPRTNPDFFIVLIFYIFSISYGAWVLMQLREGVNNTEIADFPTHWMFSSFQDHIMNVFCVAIISFASLIIYIPYTLKVLDPSYVIEILASEITRKNLRAVSDTNSTKLLSKAVNEFIDYFAIEPISSEITIFRKTMKLENDPLFIGCIPPEKLDTFILDEEVNPIEPLIDVIVYFLDKNEFIFAEKGLKELRSKTKNLLNNEIETLTNDLLASLKNKLNRFKFSKHLFKEKTEKGTDFHDNSNIATILSKLNSKLFTIGTLSIEKKAEKCIEYVLLSLYYNGLNLAKLSPKCGGDIESVEDIKKIVIMSLKDDIIYSTYTGLRLLSYFAIFSISRDNKELTLKIVRSLKQINNLALEKNVPNLAQRIELARNDIYQFSLAKGNTFAQAIKKEL